MERISTQDSFINAIRQLADLSDREIALIDERFTPRIIRRKTTLLSAGQTAREVYYIYEGCMRLYYEKEGEDISAYFFTEGMFAGAYDSFASLQPSRHSIETIEDCRVRVVSYSDFESLFTEVPAMNEVARKIIGERFIALHQLYTSQLLDSPEERYLNLLQYRPDLLNRVPQHQIATFLGVTPVSLSRIKNRAAKARI